MLGTGNSARGVLVATALAVIVVLLFLIIGYSIQVLFLAFAGILLAILLQSMSEGVSRLTRLSRGWSLTVVIVGLVFLIAGVFWLSGTRIASQADELGKSLGRSLSQFRDWLNNYQWGRGILSQLQRLPANQALWSRVTGYLSISIGAIGGLVIVASIGIYGAADPHTYLSGFVRLFPAGERERVGKIAGQLGHTLRWWLVGQISDMAVVGVLTYIGLRILDVPLALILALIAALLDFIPYIGPILAAIPAVLMGLIHGPGLALSIIVLYVVVQAIEGQVTAPLIHRATVDLPPALTIFAVVFLGTLVGILGALLATPLAAAALVLVKTLYIRDYLGEDVKT